MKKFFSSFSKKKTRELSERQANELGLSLGDLKKIVTWTADEVNTIIENVKAEEKQEEEKQEEEKQVDEIIEKEKETINADSRIVVNAIRTMVNAIRTIILIQTVHNQLLEDNNIKIDVLSQNHLKVVKEEFSSVQEIVETVSEELKNISLTPAQVCKQTKRAQGPKYTTSTLFLAKQKQERYDSGICRFDSDGSILCNCLCQQDKVKFIVNQTKRITRIPPSSFVLIIRAGRLKLVNNYKTQPKDCDYILKPPLYLVHFLNQQILQQLLKPNLSFAKRILKQQQQLSGTLFKSQAIDRPFWYGDLNHNVLPGGQNLHKFFDRHNYFNDNLDRKTTRSSTAVRDDSDGSSKFSSSFSSYSPSYSSRSDDFQSSSYDDDEETLTSTSSSTDASTGGLFYI